MRLLLSTILTCFVTFCIICPKAANCAELSSNPIVVPKLIIGKWYLKSGQKMNCHDALSQRSGIELFPSGEVSSVNGLYTCTINTLDHFDPTSYGKDMIGVWSYKATCKTLASYNGSFAIEKSEWQQSTDLKLVQGATTDLIITTRKEAFKIGDQPSLSEGTYQRCPDIL
jgi:hypothetical protein